jgi:type IV pilus assembly protein PilV
MIRRPTLHRSGTRSGQVGATMIELLVAFVIFSFGVIGIVGLQARTLSFSQTSLYRSQAVALTDDILDRMRADRAQAVVSKSWNTPIEDKAADVKPAGLGVVGTDLADWKAQVEALMPEGAASIRVEPTGEATIIIEWSEKFGATDNLKGDVSRTNSFSTVTLL